VPTLFDSTSRWVKYDFPSLVDLVLVWRMNMTREDWPDCGQGTTIDFMLWHYILIFKKRVPLLLTKHGPRWPKKSGFSAILDPGMLNMGWDRQPVTGTVRSTSP